MAADKPDDKTTSAADAAAGAEQVPKETKAAALGEDDEFEDFPVDGAFLYPLRDPRIAMYHVLGNESTVARRDDKVANLLVDWPEDQTEAAQGSSETKHLWEESWDDDDTTDDFSTQLKCVAQSQIQFPNSRISKFSTN